MRRLTLDSITEILAAEGRIELRRFGVLEAPVRKGRTGRDPRTGEKVVVPEKRRVAFKPGKLMEAPAAKKRRARRHRDGCERGCPSGAFSMCACAAAALLSSGLA